MLFLRSSDASKYSIALIKIVGIAPDSLFEDDGVETALQKFDKIGVMQLPVVSPIGVNASEQKMLGWADYSAAMSLINKRLIDAHKEVHE